MYRLPCWKKFTVGSRRRYAAFTPYLQMYVLRVMFKTIFCVNIYIYIGISHKRCIRMFDLMVNEVCESGAGYHMYRHSTTQVCL